MAQSGIINRSSFLASWKNQVNFLALVVSAALASYLIVAVVIDATHSVPYPLPHDYGEGILAWMTQEITAGRSPYGDITAVPSRYAAYGPLSAWLTAPLASLLGDDPSRFIQAGRILNLVYWLAAGAIVGLLCQPRLAVLALSPALALSICHLPFMVGFRVDSLMIMLEAAILYVLVKQNRMALWAVLPVLVTLLVLVKPTASLDLPILGILALALCPKTAKAFIQDTWRPILVAIILAPLVFFVVDWSLYGGWMSNNVLNIQRISGWAEPYSPEMMVGTFLMKPAIWPLVLWALWGPSAQPFARARLAFVAIGLAFIMNGALSLKYGAVTNYFFPMLVVMLGSATFLLKNNVQIMLFLLTIAAATLPLEKQPGPFRATANDKARSAMLSSRIVDVHKTDAVITEDVFFSVLAGHQPLISDIFQYNVVAKRRAVPAQQMLSATEVLWSDFRVKSLLGLDRGERLNFASPSFVPAFRPAPPHLRGMVFSPSDLPQEVFMALPKIPDYPPPLGEYLRKMALPGLLLILIAALWDFRPPRPAPRPE